jgi:hypothetical protein
MASTEKPALDVVEYPRPADYCGDWLAVVDAPTAFMIAWAYVQGIDRVTLNGSS